MEDIIAKKLLKIRFFPLRKFIAENCSESFYYTNINSFKNLYTTRELNDKYARKSKYTPAFKPKTIDDLLQFIKTHAVFIDVYEFYLKECPPEKINWAFISSHLDELNIDFSNLLNIYTYENHSSNLYCKGIDANILIKYTDELRIYDPSFTQENYIKYQYKLSDKCNWQYFAQYQTFEQILDFFIKTKVFLRNTTIYFTPILKNEKLNINQKIKLYKLLTT